MTTSETEKPATGPEDDPEPTHVNAPTGAWDPNTPPPTGAWDPNTPPPTGAWDPNTPPPTGAWDPNTPPPTGAWDPNTPPPTGAWDPNTPPPTGAWDPNSPPPTGAWDPNNPPQPQPPAPQPQPPALRPQPGNGTAPQATGLWIRNRVITHLLSSSACPGVWVFVAGLGWKQLAAVETGRSPLTGLAVLAKANGLTVSFHENAYGLIDQLLV
ncbi:hypothetical protein LWP59_01420 [Amycolatopsis acidiphila]|uniref:Uncharacterized protein n=1 Tax=Amycolatopsis acidiphila TaxID=715473 RepID=A0A558AMZ5_9PSEU|nr:hypothetical protein [Amycolatopsis acidiphila]TVT25633.1 hypothetical protein FNH06_02165 [Amycolatopsis acidiphila]UIJ60388.1 hypothetical protein LWP59_01420 [Amycolatopsis acidiphila]GHG90447.1 hypothetical protein GCM10017788_65850 [Amycolatopsis acidiphila]